jgi:hypothetical protein
VLTIVVSFIVVFVVCLCVMSVICLLYCCTTAIGLKPNCSLTYIYIYIYIRRHSSVTAVKTSNLTCFIILAENCNSDFCKSEYDATSNKCSHVGQGDD